MLLFTRRPMVFLLGSGSYPVTAASVLRPCRSHYGQGRRDLEANGESFPRTSPGRGRGHWGGTGTRGARGAGRRVPGTGATGTAGGRDGGRAGECVRGAPRSPITPPGRRR